MYWQQSFGTAEMIDSSSSFYKLKRVPKKVVRYLKTEQNGRKSCIQIAFS